MNGTKAWRSVAMTAGAVLLIGGCATADNTSAPTTSAPPSATTTMAPLDMARTALMAAEEIPTQAEGMSVETGDAYTAAGAGEVGAPWPQVALCSTVVMPDEGPPTTAEPGAVAGAWTFGVATDPDHPTGWTQIDQYAVVYRDEAAAKAAVQRARALDCEAAIRSGATDKDTWTIDTGPVPSNVDGFSTNAAFDHGKGPEPTISTVMRSGPVVHYMRAAGPFTDAYADQLRTAAAQSLMTATH